MKRFMGVEVYLASVVGILVLFFAFESEAWVNSTLHHEFSAMSDLDENGIPDDLEAYLSETALPDPYDPNESDLDNDGMSDLGEWILGTDPLAEEPQLASIPQASTNSGGGLQIVVQLPLWFGRYAEVLARPSLTTGSWQAVESWIPTYGEPQLLWEDVLRPEDNSFFYFVSDGTFDYDGDGYSDNREYYVEQTDPEVFNSANIDNDWMHDWWEEKIFGDLSQSGTDDYDGDGLLNNQELVWVSSTTIVMYSDPSLYDSDADTLNDADEGTYQTNPMEADTDEDGLDDNVELAGRTDPLNPDAITPIITIF